MWRQRVSWAGPAPLGEWMEWRRSGGDIIRKPEMGAVVDTDGKDTSHKDVADKESKKMASMPRRVRGFCNFMATPDDEF